MYKKEFFAETREQAVSMAAAYFEVDAGKLEVSEIPGSVAVVGMGDRKCFVISIEGTADHQPPEQDRSGSRDRRRSGPDSRERDSRGSRDRDSRGGRGRGRDGDRGRSDRPRDDRSRGGDRGRGGDRRRAPRGDRPEGVDHERLEAVARDAAEQVKRTGDPVTLDWMNSKERWVVHNYLKDVDGVTSISEGEGADKRLKIIPD